MPHELRRYVNTEDKQNLRQGSPLENNKDVWIWELKYDVALAFGQLDSKFDNPGTSVV